MHVSGVTDTGNLAVGIQVGERLLFDLIELNRLDLIRHLELLKEKDDLVEDRASAEVMDDGI